MDQIMNVDSLHNSINEVQNDTGERVTRTCPLCRSAVKLFYINFNEKLLMCEKAECDFPFGYEQLQIVSSEGELKDQNAGSMISFRTNNTQTCTSSISTSAWADLDKLNKINDSEDFDTKSMKNKKLKPRMEIKNEGVIKQDIDKLNKLHKELYSSDEEEEPSIVNEHWLKNLMTLQGHSGKQLLKEQETEHLKQNKQTHKTNKQLKININPQQDNISVIDIQFCEDNVGNKDKKKNTELNNNANSVIKVAKANDIILKKNQMHKKYNNLLINNTHGEIGAKSQNNDSKSIKIIESIILTKGCVVKDEIKCKTEWDQNMTNNDANEFLDSDCAEKIHQDETLLRVDKSNETINHNKETNVNNEITDTGNETDLIILDPSNIENPQDTHVEVTSLPVPNNNELHSQSQKVSQDENTNNMDVIKVIESHNILLEDINVIIDDGINPLDENKSLENGNTENENKKKDVLVIEIIEDTSKQSLRGEKLDCIDNHVPMSENIPLQDYNIATENEIACKNNNTRQNNKAKETNNQVESETTIDDKISLTQSNISTENDVAMKTDTNESTSQNESCETIEDKQSKSNKSCTRNKITVGTSPRSSSRLKKVNNNIDRNQRRQPVRITRSSCKKT